MLQGSTKTQKQGVDTLCVCGVWEVRGRAWGHAGERSGTVTPYTRNRSIRAACKEIGILPVLVFQGLASSALSVGIMPPSTQKPQKQSPHRPAPQRRRTSSAEASSPVNAFIIAIAVAIAAVAVWWLMPPAMRDSTVTTLANYTVWILRSDRTNSTESLAVEPTFDHLALRVAGALEKSVYDRGLVSRQRVLP